MDELDDILAGIPGGASIPVWQKQAALDAARIPDAAGLWPGDPAYVPTYDPYYAAMLLVGFLQAQGAVTATSSEGTSVTTTGPDWASLLRYLGQSSRIARLVGFFSVVTIPDGLDIRRVPMGGGDVDTD